MWDDLREYWNGEIEETTWIRGDCQRLTGGYVLGYNRKQTGDEEMAQNVKESVNTCKFYRNSEKSNGNDAILFVTLYFIFYVGKVRKTVYRIIFDVLMIFS